MGLRQIIKRIPVPFCGVALAVVALGTITERWAAWTWPLCGVLFSIMICLFFAKVVMFPQEIRADLNKPVPAGVIGTLPMALLYSSTYLARFSWHAGFILWVASIALYLGLIAWFSVKFARTAHIGDLTPAYFVIYIGVLAIAATAPALNMQAIGLVVSRIGMLIALVLVILVTVRIVRSPLPEPLRPMMCIYAAPPSMCLASYLSCVALPSEAFVYVLYALSCVFYLIGLASLLVCLKLPFYPTYAAMTFPFVISASASAKFAALMSGYPGFGIVAGIQLAIACAAVVYVFIRYAMFLLACDTPA